MDQLRWVELSCFPGQQTNVGAINCNQLHNEEEKPLESLIATTLREPKGKGREKEKGRGIYSRKLLLLPIWGCKSYRAVALATSVLICDLRTCANWKTVRTDFSHFSFIRRVCRLWLTILIGSLTFCVRHFCIGWKLKTLAAAAATAAAVAIRQADIN